MTLNERLQEAFDKRVGGTAMLPASDLLSAITAIEQLEAQYNQISFVLDSTERDKESLEETITQHAAEIKQLRTEADFNFEQYQDAGRLMFELQAVTEQQAEAIRLKDEALDFIDSENASEEVLRRASTALIIQSSPEILQARDERVAEACAKLVNRFIGGDGILNDTWVHEIEDEIRSGEWRKYL